MKKLTIYLGMIFCMSLATTMVSAQDSGEAGEAITYTLPEMRVMDIEGTAPSLTFTAPSEAGESIADVTSNTSWINYTSIVASGSTNKVTVTLGGTGTLPTGTTLKVVAAADAGAGNGTVGTPTTAVTLSASAQDLITSIGSCYTGNGSSSGHQLTYTWSISSDSYASVVSNTEASDLTATYTIIADGYGY